jgi:hypothetical protein
MIRRITFVLGLFVCILFVCQGARAQATATSNVEGTTSDQQQKPIVGAKVTLTNKGTGETRTANSIENGYYRFELVPPGIYTVKATSSGFKTVVVDDLQVLIGGTTTVNLKFEVGEISQTVEVSGQTPIIDTTKTNVGQTLTPQDIQNLPLNGRDFANLAYLVPGAQPVSSYDPTKNRIGIFGTNGSGGRNVNVTVNGIDDKDSTVGGPVMQLPLTAVQEFSISTQRFTASNGRSEGSAVNVITKSGTNRLHGDIYFFDTETAFNANDYFSKQSGSPTPAFQRQQFGGDVGGPIIKDKLFFFGALERSREQTAIGVTSQAFTELTLATPIGAQPANTIPTPYFDWRYNGRMDYHLSNKHVASLSYSGQSNNGLNDQSGQTNDLTAGNFTTNALIISNFNLTSMFTPNIVNSFTAGYQYWNNVINTAKKSAFTINFPSGIYFGTNGNVPQQSIQKKWQFKDDFSVSRGAHSLKFGVDYTFIAELGGYFEFTPVPSLTFSDLPSVILSNTIKYPNGFASPGAVTAMTGAAGDPRFFDSGPGMFGAYAQDVWKARPGLTVDLGLRWDKDIGLYGGNLQSMSRAFLLLRAIGNPFGSHVPQDDNRGFQPRIGFAWDIKGTGKHILRGGYGMYFGNTFQNIPLFMIQQTNPFIFATVFNITSAGFGDPNCLPANCTVPGTSILLSNWRFGVDPAPVLPPPPTSLPAGATARLMDPNYRNPYTEQFNVGYSWELDPSNVIEVSYVHVLGLHEAARQNINPINPATGARVLHAAFAAAGITPTSTPAEPGIVIVDSSINRSRYDGLDISYRRRMSKRFSINTSYVLSRSVGWDGQPAGFGNTPVNPFNPWDPAVDFGYVQNDERHRWTFGGLVDLPWGIEVAPVIQASSPRSITPASGQSNFFGFGSSVGAAHAIVPANDPTNFTFYSALPSSHSSIVTEQACLNSGQCIEVPLGAARGFSFFNADVRVSKTFRFGDWGKLRLIFQGFDITNRANFGTNINTNIRASAGGFRTPLGFITGNGTIVPRSFRGEFGAEFVF